MASWRDGLMTSREVFRRSEVSGVKAERGDKAPPFQNQGWGTRKTVADSSGDRRLIVGAITPRLGFAVVGDEIGEEGLVFPGGLVPAEHFRGAFLRFAAQFLAKIGVA
jgi:hypothetical protein